MGQLLAAMFPGTSRSAATILLIMLLGLSRPVATEFSFLVGVPTLLAAGGLEMMQALRHPTGPPTDWGLLALGTAGLRGDRLRGRALAAPVDPDAQLRPVRMVPGGARSRPADPARLSRPDWR